MSSACGLLIPVMVVAVLLFHLHVVDGIAAHGAVYDAVTRVLYDTDLSWPRVQITGMDAASSGRARDALAGLWTRLAGAGHGTWICMGSRRALAKMGRKEPAGPPLPPKRAAKMAIKESAEPQPATCSSPA